MTATPRGIVVDRDLGFNAIIDQIELAAKSYVKVGILAASLTHAQNKFNSQTGKQRTKPAGQSIAQIGIDNEYGVRTRNRFIPERSFMRSSFDENRDRINRILAREYDKIVAGTSTVFRSLSLLGTYMEGLIRQKIRAIQTPANSPLTIAAKGSSKPLIDFGQMIASISHEVVLQ